MRAAVLHELDGPPRAGEFDEPVAEPGHVVVEAGGAGLHHLDLHKATGRFYLGPPPLPSVVGTDGVGTLPDGRRVYFDAAKAPFGTMAERSLVREDSLFEVPDGIDDALAAALGNTGIGAWLALAWRSGLQPGETVLVLGATGAFGAVAVQAAKLLGAGRVVAAARASERLTRLLDRGADAIVELDAHDDLRAAFADASEGGVDVTIDTLWGAPGLAAMQAARRFARHLEVGNLAGPEIALPAPAIRSISLDVRGFSGAHPSTDVKREAHRALVAAVMRGDVVVEHEAVPLADVARAWERERAGTKGVKLVIDPRA